MANYDPNDPRRTDATDPHRSAAPETYVEPVERRASPLPLIIGILLALAIAYFVLQYFMNRNEVTTGDEPAATTTTAPATDTPAAAAAPAATPTVGIDDFAKLDLRIGKVLERGFVEGSDKLLRFVLAAGELGQRQIFSGIRASYGEPEKLVGRNVVFIANLAPRKMRFGLSEGMILSAGFDGGALALLDADAGAQPGMPVR